METTGLTPKELHREAMEAYSKALHYKDIGDQPEQVKSYAKNALNYEIEAVKILEKGDFAHAHYTKGVLYQSAATIALLLASYQKNRLEWYTIVSILLKLGLQVAQEPVLKLQLEEMQQLVDDKIASFTQSKEESLHNIQELIAYA